MSHIRSYNAARDCEAVVQIWREVHWVKNEEQAKRAPLFFESSRTNVAEINGQVECQASSIDGTFRYLKQDIPMCAIIGVTTSRIARKLRLAQQTTAQLIAEETASGADLCILTMFEQGFYDRMGFGTGSYGHTVRFDPADLMINIPFRIPKRLTAEDWSMIHSSMMNRKLIHGACRLNSAPLMRAELYNRDKSFALGYCDEAQGELTHFFWATDNRGEHGPCDISFIAYQNHRQFLELLALIKSLGDQVRLFTLEEPQDIQLQDLIKQPFRGRMISEKGDFNQMIQGSGYWQARICNIEACIAKTCLDGPTIQFNLVLEDPIEKYLTPSMPWRGISGEYIITLGNKSKASVGSASNLQTLKASVGAFTRLWLGVRPASGLATTDDLQAPPELLEKLDSHLRLPTPGLGGWQF